MAAVTILGLGQQQGPVLPESAYAQFDDDEDDYDPLTDPDEDGD